MELILGGQEEHEVRVISYLRQRVPSSTVPRAYFLFGNYISASTASHQDRV